jgi:hypothetical protein
MKTSLNKILSILTIVFSIIGYPQTPIVSRQPISQAIDNATIQITSSGSRVIDGLQLLYDFKEAGGDTIHDNSSVGTPYNLELDNPSAVTWTPNGLGINDLAYINTAPAATKVITASKLSNELTIELWIRPALVNQTGGSRIITISKDYQNSNFSVLQNDGYFDFRSN